MNIEYRTGALVVGNKNAKIYGITTPGTVWKVVGNNLRRHLYEEDADAIEIISPSGRGSTFTVRKNCFDPLATEVL